MRTSTKRNLPKQYLFVGSKAKRVNLQTGVSRKQSTPNFSKNEPFLPPDTYTYVCLSGVRNVRFSENLTCFVFLKHRFWDSPFCLATDVLLVKSLRTNNKKRKLKKEKFEELDGIVSKMNEIMKSYKTGLIVKNSIRNEIVVWYMGSPRIKRKTQTKKQ